MPRKEVYAHRSAIPQAAEQAPALTAAAVVEHIPAPASTPFVRFSGLIRPFTASTFVSWAHSLAAAAPGDTAATVWLHPLKTSAVVRYADKVEAAKAAAAGTGALFPRGRVDGRTVAAEASAASPDEARAAAEAADRAAEEAGRAERLAAAEAARAAMCDRLQAAAAEEQRRKEVEEVDGRRRAEEAAAAGAAAEVPHAQPAAAARSVVLAAPAGAAAAVDAGPMPHHASTARTTADELFRRTETKAAPPLYWLQSLTRRGVHNAGARGGGDAGHRG